MLPCLGLIGLIGDCGGDIRHNNSHRGDTPSNSGSGEDNRNTKKTERKLYFPVMDLEYMCDQTKLMGYTSPAQQTSKILQEKYLWVFAF